MGVLGDEVDYYIKGGRWGGVIFVYFVCGWCFVVLVVYLLMDYCFFD